ncbi:uncharacterized protein LOC129762077 [Toxorhynchites rutilus septentrionalis]|uniref:uncharacterized protein LOC129762077 n=1 Tax=Toxorhynchites rutilus septentrionalis TaxID=329112 RepID=UPI00247A39D9|nr:uncharacterized protein LOC129762077 [Toxorhynchites rutilus septentrionalis]
MKVNLFMILPTLVIIVSRSECTRGNPVNEGETPNHVTLTDHTSVESGHQTLSSALPLLIFPKDSNVYKIVQNETALRILQARSGSNVTPPTAEKSAEGQIVPTVHGANDASNGAGTHNGGIPSSSISYDEKEVTDDYSDEKDDDDDVDDDDDDDDGEEDDSINNDAESIQPEDRDKEDGLEEQFRNSNDDDKHFPLVLDNTVIEVSAMRQEHLWIIMVGVVFALSLTAYVAMVIYRNGLEKRYGMRQRLVTEDDYYTNNDI